MSGTRLVTGILKDGFIGKFKPSIELKNEQFLEKRTSTTT